MIGLVHSCVKFRLQLTTRHTAQHAPSRTTHANSTKLGQSRFLSICTEPRSDRSQRSSRDASERPVAVRWVHRAAGCWAHRLAPLQQASPRIAGPRPKLRAPPRLGAARRRLPLRLPPFAARPIASAARPRRPRAARRATPFSVLRNCNAHPGEVVRARGRARARAVHVQLDRVRAFRPNWEVLSAIWVSTATVNCRLSNALSRRSGTREISCNCRLSIVDGRYHSGGMKENVRESGLGCCE